MCSSVVKMLCVFVITLKPQSLFKEILEDQR
jgi:hypothetical protein